MFGAETGLTYRVWLTPSEVTQLDRTVVCGTLEESSFQRLRLLLQIADTVDLGVQVEFSRTDDQVRIRLSRECYGELCAEGLVSMVTDNLELIEAYDVSRYGSPDDTLRQLR